MKPITEISKVRAATNAPELAKRKVTLGDREFAILDLPYDAYILFIAQLKPLLAGLLGGLASKIPGLGSAVSSDSLSAASLVLYCCDSLPEMARLVCAQSDPTITVAEVKSLGKTPFALALLVLAQIEQNNIVSEVKDFFGHIAPLLSALIPGPAKLTT